MRMFKKCLLAMASVLPVVATAAQAETWDMPTAYPVLNFQTVNAQEFADCVAKGTSGDISIVLHPNGSLFKGNDIKRAVQTGQVQIGERLLSAHENENPLFGTDSIPFIANSYDASIKLYAAARPQLEKVLADQGLVLLYSVPWPPQGLYFKKPVDSAKDMAGAKVRSYNKSTARLAAMTGMVPVQIEAAEIGDAMAAGVINSLITSSVTGQDSKVWEQLTNFYEVQAWLPRNSVIVNKGVWDALTPEKRGAIGACAKAAEAAGLEKSKAANDGALATLKKNGMQVSQPSATLAADLKKIGDSMAKEWVTNAGEPGKAVIDSYNK